MNRISRIVMSVVVSVVILFFSSCDQGNGGEDIPKKTGVLIVNEGNYGAGNGSISIYDEEQMTISNDVVKNANGGSEIGSSIQSMYQHDGVGYLVCNGTDKVEFISMEDFTFLSNPLTNLSQPRYMTVVGDKGYITCWGPWNFTNYTLPDSYVAVMDLNSKTIIDTLQCGSGPEGIIAVRNKLYVANSFEMTISVIDLENQTSLKINLIALPKHFTLDKSGFLWVSVSSGLYSINTNTGLKADSLLVTNIDGKMAIDGDLAKLYLITTEPWDATKPNSASEVRVFDIQTKTLASTPLITGSDFYGIAYNETTDKLYVGDSKAFSGPGQIYVYDAVGMKLDDQITSVGPNGFTFK